MISVRNSSNIPSYPFLQKKKRKSALTSRISHISYISPHSDGWRFQSGGFENPEDIASRISQKSLNFAITLKIHSNLVWQCVFSKSLVPAQLYCSGVVKTFLVRHLVFACCPIQKEIHLIVFYEKMELLYDHQWHQLSWESTLFQWKMNIRNQFF